jgi:ribosome biogenesis GTPase A
VFPWAEYFFFCPSLMTHASSLWRCAVAAQPGHTKELQSVQLERGLRIIDSPDVIFEDNDSIQGQKESSVLLRNVVKPGDALRRDRFVRFKEVGQC